MADHDHGVVTTDFEQKDPCGKDHHTLEVNATSNATPRLVKDFVQGEECVLLAIGTLLPLIVNICVGFYYFEGVDTYEKLLYGLGIFVSLILH
jgi:hypothetical protein